MNDFALRSPITVLVENLSEDSIWFPPDMGATLYMYSEPDGTWQELRNRVRYGSQEPVVLDPAGTGMWATVTTVAPEIPPSGGSITVRAVIQGRVYRAGSPSDDIVGVYTDVELHP